MHFSRASLPEFRRAGHSTARSQALWAEVHSHFVGCLYGENPEIGVLADCKRAPGEFTNPCAVFSKQNKMCIKDLLIIWIQIKCSWDILSVCMSCVCTELMYKLIL